MSDRPWVLMGDWNVSLHDRDHSEGGSYKTNDMVDFQECLDNIEVEDINSTGVHFTWVQSRLNPSNGIMKKIDRVMGNIDFMSMFSNSYAHFLPHLTSDHSPAVLIIPNMTRKKHKAFRFSNFVADKPVFTDIVQKEWNIQVDGCFMFKLVKKLKALKIPMKNLSWSFGNLNEKVVEWSDKLKDIQILIDKDPHNRVLKQEEALILHEYKTAVHDEEKFLKQKAKIDWLSDGDKNSKFFYAVIKGRAHRSKIEAVNDENGIRYEGALVADQFVKHFQTFLGVAIPVQTIDLNSLNAKTVSSEDAEIMIKEVHDKEVKEALFDICDNKALGPSYTAKFYKKAWCTVGRDVCEAIKEFIRNGKLLGEVNATLITLVPKSNTPQKVSDPLLVVM